MWTGTPRDVNVVDARSTERVGGQHGGRLFEEGQDHGGVLDFSAGDAAPSSACRSTSAVEALGHHSDSDARLP